MPVKFAVLLLLLQSIIIISCTNTHFEHILLFKRQSGQAENCPICLEEFKDNQCWVYATHPEEQTNSKRHLIHIACFTANALGFSNECSVCKQPLQKMSNFNLDFLTGLFDLSLLAIYHRQVKKIEFSQLKILLLLMQKQIHQPYAPIQREIVEKISIESKTYLEKNDFMFKDLFSLFFGSQSRQQQQQQETKAEMLFILNRDAIHLFEIIKFTEESFLQHAEKGSNFQCLYYLLEEMGKFNEIVQLEDYWLNWALVTLGNCGIDEMFKVILQHQLIHVLEAPMFCTALYDLNHLGTLERALEEQPSGNRQLKRVVFYVFTALQNLQLMRKYAGELENFDEFDFHYVFHRFTSQKYIEKCKLLVENCRIPTVQLKIMQNMAKYFRLYPERLPEFLSLLHLHTNENTSIMRALVGFFRGRRMWKQLQICIPFVKDSYLSVAVLYWLLERNWFPSDSDCVDLKTMENSNLLTLLAIEASKKEKEAIFDSITGFLPNDHFIWSKILSSFRLEQCLQKILHSPLSKKHIHYAHLFCNLQKHLSLLPIVLGRLKDFPTRYLESLLIQSEMAGFSSYSWMIREKLNAFEGKSSSTANNQNIFRLEKAIQNAIQAEQIEEAKDIIKSIQDPYLEIGLFAISSRGKRQEIAFLISENLDKFSRDLIGTALAIAIEAENQEAIEFIVEEANERDPALAKGLFCFDLLEEFIFQKLLGRVTENQEHFGTFLFEAAFEFLEKLGKTGKIQMPERFNACLALIPREYLEILLVKAEIIQNKKAFMTLRTLLSEME